MKERFTACGVATHSAATLAHTRAASRGCADNAYAALTPVQHNECQGAG